MATVLEPDGEQTCSLDPVFFQHLKTWEAQSYIPLPFQLRQKKICGDSCICTCHTLQRSVQTLHSPGFLASLIGRLFITYSGLPFLQPSCSSPSCCDYSTWAFKATYRFPKWIFKAALHVVRSWKSEVPMTLFVQWRIPEHDETGLFELCIKGGNEGIKKLLVNRLVSPNVAELSRGHTPLHVSFTFRKRWSTLIALTQKSKISIHKDKVETARLLLQFGANPDLEQDTGMYATSTLFQTDLCSLNIQFGVPDRLV